MPLSGSTAALTNKDIKLHYPGTKVRHKATRDVGIVIRVSGNKITVNFGKRRLVASYPASLEVIIGKEKSTRK